MSKDDYPSPRINPHVTDAHQRLAQSATSSIPKRRPGTEEGRVSRSTRATSTREGMTTHFQHTAQVGHPLLTPADSNRSRSLCCRFPPTILSKRGQTASERSFILCRSYPVSCSTFTGVAVEVEKRKRGFPGAHSSRCLHVILQLPSPTSFSSLSLPLCIFHSCSSFYFSSFFLSCRSLSLSMNFSSKRGRE